MDMLPRRGQGTDLSDEEQGLRAVASAASAVLSLMHGFTQGADCCTQTHRFVSTDIVNRAR